MKQKKLSCDSSLSEFLLWSLCCPVFVALSKVLKWVYWFNSFWRLIPFLFLPANNTDLKGKWPSFKGNVSNLKTSAWKWETFLGFVFIRASRKQKQGSFDSYCVRTLFPRERILDARYPGVQGACSKNGSHLICARHGCWFFLCIEWEIKSVCVCAHPLPHPPHTLIRLLCHTH